MTARGTAAAEPLLGPVDLREVCGGHYFQNPLTGHRWHDAPEGVHSATDKNGEKLDWVIAGGESGKGSRPCHPDWARGLRDQCAAAGVPFFWKQWGDWAPGCAFGLESDKPITDKNGNVRDWMNRYVICCDRGDRLRSHSFTGHSTDLVYRVGKRRASALLDGQMHRAAPAGWAA